MADAATYDRAEWRDADESSDLLEHFIEQIEESLKAVVRSSGAHYMRPADFLRAITYSAGADWGALLELTLSQHETPIVCAEAVWPHDKASATDLGEYLTDRFSPRHTQPANLQPTLCLAGWLGRKSRLPAACNQPSAEDTCGLCPSITQALEAYARLSSDELNARFAGSCTLRDGTLVKLVPFGWQVPGARDLQLCLVLGISPEIEMDFPVSPASRLFRASAQLLASEPELFRSDAGGKLVRGYWHDDLRGDRGDVRTRALDLLSLRQRRPRPDAEDLVRLLCDALVAATERWVAPSDGNWSATRRHQDRDELLLTADGRSPLAPSMVLARFATRESDAEPDASSHTLSDDLRAKAALATCYSWAAARLLVDEDQLRIEDDALRLAAERLEAASRPGIALDLDAVCSFRRHSRDVYSNPPVDGPWKHPRTDLPLMLMRAQWTHVHALCSVHHQRGGHIPEDSPLSSSQIARRVCDARGTTSDTLAAILESLGSGPHSRDPGAAPADGGVRPVLVDDTWLDAWFALLLLQDDTLEALVGRQTATDGDSPDSAVERVTMAHALSVLMLHIVHQFSAQTRDQRRPFPHRPEQPLEAILYLLCEYAHRRLNVPRTIPLYDTVDKTWEAESSLYALKDAYREHVRHATSVCLLGMLLLGSRREGTSEPLHAEIGLHVPHGGADTRSQWVVAALLHDIGYPLRLWTDATKQVGHLDCALVKGVSDAIGATQDAQRMVFQDAARREFRDLCRKEDDFGFEHSVVGALHLAHLLDKPKLKAQYRAAMRAVFAHGLAWCPITADSDPLAVLLTVVDRVQDWGRPRVSSASFRRGLHSLLLSSEPRQLAAARVVDGFAVHLNVTAPASFLQPVLPGDGLRFELGYADPDVVDYEPSMVWLDIASDLQRIGRSWRSPLPEVTIRAYHPMAKDGLCRQIDYLRDFLQEPPDAGESRRPTGMLDWLHRLAKGGVGEPFAYYDLSRTTKEDPWPAPVTPGPHLAYPDLEERPTRLEHVSFRLPATGIEPGGVRLPELPEDLFDRFSTWKRHRKRTLRLGAGLYLSDRTQPH